MHSSRIHRIVLLALICAGNFLRGRGSIIPDSTETPDTSQQPFILLANEKAIKRVHVDGSGQESIIKHLGKAVGIDYDARANEIFWTNRDQILRANLNDLESKQLVTEATDTPTGLAWDWVNKVLYWTSNRRTIEVIDPTSNNQTIHFIAQDDSDPQSIVVDPQTRYLYWTDNSTGNERISRASMDGKMIEVLHNEKLKDPTALTIDYETQTLYWMNSFQDEVTDSPRWMLEKSNVDGSNRTVLAENISADPFGMGILDDFFYWSDNLAKTIYSAPVSSPANLTALTDQLAHNTYRMVVVALKNQPMPDYTNPCLVNNGNCSHLCLLSASGTVSSHHSCACPGVMELIEGSNTICGERIHPTFPPGSCQNFTHCCRSGSNYEGSGEDECGDTIAAEWCSCSLGCEDKGTCCPDFRDYCDPDAENDYDDSDESTDELSSSSPSSNHAKGFTPSRQSQSSTSGQSALKKGSGREHQVSTSSDSHSSSSSTIGVFAGVIVVLVAAVFAVLILLAFIWHRRRKSEAVACEMHENSSALNYPGKPGFLDSMDGSELDLKVESKV